MHTFGDEISPKPLQINEIDAINLTDIDGANRSGRDRRARVRVRVPASVALQGQVCTCHLFTLIKLQRQVSKSHKRVGLAQAQSLKRHLQSALINSLFEPKTQHLQSSSETGALKLKVRRLTFPWNGIKG